MVDLCMDQSGWQINEREIDAFRNASSVKVREYFGYVAEE
jgi:hypothetical protein